MNDFAAPRIFISYSRKDGAEFAAKLRDTLTAADLSIWQDIVALEGGRDWWTQIEDALKSKSLQHFVLVVTPGALASGVVRREIRLARQEAKTVSPVKGPDLGDLSKLPRWLGQLYDLDLNEHHTTLLRVLQAPSQQKRVAMMAPEPPADYVPRPIEYEDLKKELLDTKGDSVAITAALRGAGGYGKTTLARALAHDPDIQDAYFDGILWVELGERPDNLLAIIADLIERMTGARPGFETINAAASALGEALGGRRILLVVDDVWREQDLRPFLQGGVNATRLVTTRIDNVLPASARRMPVDAMRAIEALSLLSQGLPDDQARRHSQALAKLAARLGEWAQLLKLVNGFLRDRVVKARQPLGEALAGVNRRLNEKGLVAFDFKNAEDRTKAVARTIQVSTELLEPAARERFSELGIFPEDADIPVGIVARLWANTGGLDDFETEDLLNELYGLSLLLSLDFERRTLRFHDTVRQFLQDNSGEERLIRQHQHLIASMKGIRNAEGTPSIEARYFYLYLPHHLAAGNERDSLDKLLADPGWLDAKLAATASPQSLLADFEQFGTSSLHDLIARTIRLTTSICARDQAQLLPQLYGRLMACQDPMTEQFLIDAKRLVSRPAILTARPSLTPPGAENARLEGHLDSVRVLAVMRDGRLASGSDDRTVRLWDVNIGKEIARFDGHTASVRALAVLSDDQLASASDDNSIRVWDVQTGAEIAKRTGFGTGLVALPDGRLAFGANDRTLRLWAVASGAETALSYNGRLEGLAVLPDGRLASLTSPDSGSDFRLRTIQLWDIKTGVEVARVSTTTDRVWALVPLSDGRLVSASGAGVRVWNAETDDSTTLLKEQVSCLAVASDGRLVGGYYDRLRLWDVATGKGLASFEGHTGSIFASAVLLDGRLASGSFDNTIRLWDPATRAKSPRLEVHSGIVRALSVLPFGRLASGSDDGTIGLRRFDGKARGDKLVGSDGSVSALAALQTGLLASGTQGATVTVWNVEARTKVARLGGHKGWVRALAVLEDGRLVSCSNDKTIRIWNVASASQMSCMWGHTDSVRALTVLPDGRLASGSYDRTIRIWDLNEGVELARFVTGARIYALAALANDFLACGSDCESVGLWNLNTGIETARLVGHTARITALAAMPNGRLASGSADRTVRVWDTFERKEICRFEADVAIFCLAALPNGQLIAGDQIGRLHWLEIVD